jgi:hypothetical protein
MVLEISTNGTIAHVTFSMSDAAVVVGVLWIIVFSGVLAAVIFSRGIV